MCRLYGFRASHPSELECDLIEAQNSLVRQSQKDERGLENPDGWGVGLVQGGRVSCEREVGPAHESEEYRRDAMDARATTVLAHVRRATVGEPAPENTHPFRHGDAVLVHNGHVGAFEQVRPRMLEAMSPELAESVAGSTDSEHFFHLLLTRWGELGGSPEDPDPGLMRRAVKASVEDVLRWHGEASPPPEDPREREVALNVLWAVGDTLAGSRLGRSLWYVERDGRHRCGVCGNLHPDPAPEDYRAAVLASERITDESWTEVPEGSAFCVTPDFRVEFEALDVPVAA